MDKELIRLVLADQEKAMNERLQREDMIRRDIAASIRFERPAALVVLGIRRCGKSTLSAQLFHGHKFGYVNFDDERLLGATKDDLNSILQVFYEMYGPGLDRIILDEIQLVKGWELFVSRLRDTKRVIVTGSSSKLLSGELATHLTGRHMDVLLFPFSFREFLAYRKVSVPGAFSTADAAVMVKSFTEYLYSGGFPERQTLGRQMVQGIYEDIVTKDVVVRHKVKNVEDLRLVSRFLVTNSAKEFTYSSLRKVTKVKNLITLSNWLRYLEEAYLVFRVERFSFKLKQTSLSPKKIYCVDTGIISEIGMEPTESRGRMMKNVVAVELARRGASGTKAFYWKGDHDMEVDFAIRRDKRIEQLIQVTFASSYEAVNEREIEALKAASDELRCSNLLVLTWDYEGEKSADGKRVAFMPLWKWLIKG